MSEVKVRDRVEFVGRGRKVVGTVTRIRLKKSRRARRFANQFGTDPTAADHLVAEVVPDGERSYWTVPVGRLKVLAPGKGKLDEAVKTVQEIKTNKRVRKQNRCSANYTEAAETGLLDLEPGDPIEVEFRNGRRTCTFQGFVRGSLNVRFSYMGRTRTTNPKWVHKIGGTNGQV